MTHFRAFWIDHLMFIIVVTLAELCTQWLMDKNLSHYSELKAFNVSHLDNEWNISTHFVSDPHRVVVIFHCEIYFMIWEHFVSQRDKMLPWSIIWQGIMIWEHYSLSKLAAFYTVNRLVAHRCTHTCTRIHTYTVPVVLYHESPAGGSVHRTWGIRLQVGIFPTYTAASFWRGIQIWAYSNREPAAHCCPGLVWSGMDQVRGGGVLQGCGPQKGPVWVWARAALNIIFP